jgi:hypothetical protein
MQILLPAEMAKQAEDDYQELIGCMDKRSGTSKEEANI